MKKKLDQITCTRVKATEDEKNPNGNFSLRIQQTIMLFSFVITTRFSYLDCMMFVVRLKMWYFKKNPWSEMLQKKNVVGWKCEEFTSSTLWMRFFINARLLFFSNTCVWMENFTKNECTFLYFLNAKCTF